MNIMKHIIIYNYIYICIYVHIHNFVIVQQNILALFTQCHRHLSLRNGSFADFESVSGCMVQKSLT